MFDPSHGAHDEFVCPIGMELMRDLVVAADGHSYERARIERWTAPPLSKRTSPLTGAALAHTKLMPNLTLKKSIESAMEQQVVRWVHGSSPARMRV